MLILIRQGEKVGASVILGLDHIDIQVCVLIRSLLGDARYMLTRKI